MTITKMPEYFEKKNRGKNKRQRCKRLVQMRIRNIINSLKSSRS